MEKKLLISIIAFVFILISGFALNKEKAHAPAEVVPEVDESFEVNTTETVEVYDGIKVPMNSTELNLSNQNLEGSLKAEVRLLAELQVLNISNNNFTGLPAEVGQLSKLKVLNLSNNPLTGLPHELGNLQNLKQLNLSGTNYSEFDLNIIRESLPADTEIIL